MEMRLARAKRRHAKGKISDDELARVRCQVMSDCINVAYRQLVSDARYFLERGLDAKAVLICVRMIEQELDLPVQQRFDPEAK